MPVLPAAGYDYKAYPTQTPSQDGAPYENIQAPASAFGATQGAALERLGAAGEQAGTRLADIAIARQNQFNLVVANNGTNQAQEGINKLLRGDPDDPTDPGYFGLHGDKAMYGRKPVEKKMDDLIDGIRKGMQNPLQVLHFDQETRRFRNFAMSDIGQHYDREFDHYAAETATAKVKLAGDAVAVASNNGDLARMNAALQTGLDSIQNSLGPNGMGAPPAHIEAAQKAFARESLEKWVRSSAIKDPLEAQKFVEQHKDVLGDHYDDLSRLVKAGAAKAQAIQDVNDAGYTVGGGIGVEHFLDLTEKHESGGRNIEQGVVGPQGGYNPSTGTVTGPSSASGNFQIIDSTWKRFAPLAGIDTDKYPRAIDAPYGVQRQVARTIATTDGVQHWTKWNSNLKAAVAKEGLPTTGPVSGAAGPRMVTEETAAGPVTYNANEIANSPTAPVAGDTQADLERKEKLRQQDPYLGMGVSGVGAAKSAAPDTVLLPPLENGEAPDAEIPGLAGRLNALSQRAQKENWPADRFMDAVKEARTRFNRGYADQQHALRMKTEADKANDEAIKMEYHNRMGKDSQNYPTTPEVETDKRIRLSATKTELVGYIERQTKPEPMSQISAKNRMELFRRINLPDDDPEKIRSEDDINKAYINSLISDTDHEKTIKDFERAQGATTKELETRKTRLLKAIGPKISIYLIGRTHDKALEFDPSIAEKETAWLNAVEDKIRDYKTTAGKNPRDLFSLKNPDYVGSDDFLHSVGIGLTMGDRMAAPPTKPNPFSESYPAAPATSPPDLSTKESIQKAYQLGVQGKPGGITRLQAIEAARAIGVLKDSPVPMQ